MKITRRNNRDLTQTTILVDDTPYIRYMELPKDGLSIVIEGKAGKYAGIPYRVYLSKNELDKIQSILTRAERAGILIQSETTSLT